MTPVHQIMSCEAKNCKFVINKCIGTFGQNLSVLSHKNSPTYYLTKQFWTVVTCKPCLITGYFSPDSDMMIFSLAILWIDDLYFSWKQWFEFENALMDLFHTAFHITRLELMDLKGYSTPKWKFCRFSLTPMSFRTRKSFVSLQNTI